MKVSFGKIIPVKVFVDGKETDKEKQISTVTNILCSNLRKEKHYENTWQAEQQRRYSIWHLYSRYLIISSTTA